MLPLGGESTEFTARARRGGAYANGRRGGRGVHIRAQIAAS